jgi:hypothetical protein
MQQARLLGITCCPFISAVGCSGVQAAAVTAITATAAVAAHRLAAVAGHMLAHVGITWHCGPVTQAAVDLPFCRAFLCCAVSRFVCRSELYEFDLTVDINIDIYPLKVGDVLTQVLTQQLHRSCRCSHSHCRSSSSWMVWGLPHAAVYLKILLG